MNLNNYTIEELEVKLLELENSIDKNDKKLYKDIDLYLCKKNNHRYEKKYYNLGYNLIAGVDEVGRGPLVGPVVAASVIYLKTMIYLALLIQKSFLKRKEIIFTILL